MTTVGKGTRPRLPSKHDYGAIQRIHQADPELLATGDYAMFAQVYMVQTGIEISSDTLRTTIARNPHLIGRTEPPKARGKMRDIDKKALKALLKSDATLKKNYRELHRQYAAKTGHQISYKTMIRYFQGRRIGKYAQKQPPQADNGSV